MMKARLIAVLLAVSLLCSIPANALTPPVLDGGHDEEGPFILCAEYDRTGIASWPYTKNLIVLENNEELRVQETEGSLGNVLPSQMAYVCESGKTLNIDVVWDTSDETLIQPGLHQVIGYPVTDDETILLAEGYDGKVTWPVFRKGGEALEVVSLQKPLLADPLLPLNGDTSSLCISTDDRNWGVGTDGIIKSDDSWVWTWDCSEVDTSKEGAYTVTGTLEPPQWISISNADRISQNTVYVLPTDRIEIYAAVGTLVTASGGELVIKWLYDSANVTEAVLQRMDENGLWVDCEDRWYRYNAPSKFVKGSTAKLRLRLLEISPGTEHRLRLRYLDLIDGETVERFTAPITLTMPENIEELLADSNGGIPEELNIGGDRDEDDFGDQGEIPPSGEIIPPPDTDSSTDTTNTPPTETTNNTTGTTNDTPSDSTSESTGGTTTSEPTTDSTTAPTEQPDNSEPDTSDSTEITEDKTNSTSQTENITTPSTDLTNIQPQKDGSSPHTFDIVMIVLGLAVAGGIVCILLLWRKGGRG